MPYDSNQDLPDNVRDSLPPHGQTIYREAFNSAWEQYDKPEQRRGSADREETAHRVAWQAVKQKYERKEQGEWVRKQD